MAAVRQRADDSKVDVCRAVTDHLEAIGLRAVVSEDAHPATVLIEASSLDRA